MAYRLCACRRSWTTWYVGLDERCPNRRAVAPRRARVSAAQSLRGQAGGVAPRLQAWDFCVSRDRRRKSSNAALAIAGLAAVTAAVAHRVEADSKAKKGGWNS
jgi:hypothetical protein